MSKTESTAQVQKPKRISPELAEFLHMLKSLESQPVAKPAQIVVR
jgi:hypothetical protein